MTIELNDFDLNSIPDSKKILFVGNNRSEKNSLILEYLHCHQSEFPLGIVISDDTIFENHIPATFIHKKYEKELLIQLIQRQKLLICPENTIDPRTFCVVDESNVIWEDENIKWIFFNGRCVKLTVIMSLQNNIKMPSALRTNTQYIFICRTTDLEEQKCIYGQFGEMFDSFTQFREIFLRYTENTYMVINNDIDSDKLEDRVFCFKKIDFK